MRLGLLADIHEAVELLREALALFRREGVERIVFLGDIVRMSERLEETVAIMREAGIVGVWGNHDFGMCRHPDEAVRRRWSPALLDYSATLQPRLVMEDVHITHAETWLNHEDVMELWFFEGLPKTPERLSRCFAAAPQRVLMSGHVHCWYLATPEGPLEWAGERPIRLVPPQRFYLVVHALCEGHCATYDTASGDLVPFRLTGPVFRP